MVKEIDSEDVVDKAIKPLLAKLLLEIPTDKLGLIESNDDDGLHLRFYHNESFYKVLGSAYNHASRSAHLNLIRVASAATTCRECERITDISVSGDSDLQGEYLAKYEWMLARIKNIIKQ